MNIAVTVQAGSGKHLIRRGRSLKRFKTGINVARVLGEVMAISADLGHPTGQEFVVIAAVGDMAS